MVSWLLDDGTRVHDSIALMWRGAVGQEEGSSARLQVQPLLVRYQAVASTTSSPLFFDAYNFPSPGFSKLVSNEKRFNYKVLDLVEHYNFVTLFENLISKSDNLKINIFRTKRF